MPSMTFTPPATTCPPFLRERGGLYQAGAFEPWSACCRRCKQMWERFPTQRSARIFLQRHQSRCAYYAADVLGGTDAR